MLSAHSGGGGGGGGCASLSALVPIVALACSDGVLSFIAFSQVVRIHLINQEAGWTRQKVLHVILGGSISGYGIFFIITLIAHCERWSCWSRMCGFIFTAYPRILFLAAFLLLLSFWVDLCHQANDEEEDGGVDNDENSTTQALLDPKDNSSSILEREFRCCSFQNIGGRQKFVIAVVAVVFVLMLSFAGLIWIGTGKNPIDSLSVAQIYVHISAVTTLILGGALGYYGILLVLQLRKVRSERSLDDMWKVGGLAAVSVLCFTCGALFALLTDIPLFYSMPLSEIKGAKLPLLLFIYHFIGVTVPSSFLLWFMRELPRPITSRSPGEQRVITFISYDPSITRNPSRRASGTRSRNQVFRESRT